LRFAGETLFVNKVQEVVYFHKTLNKNLTPCPLSQGRGENPPKLSFVQNLPYNFSPLAFRRGGRG
jgi:hypothetical protein